MMPIFTVSATISDLAAQANIDASSPSWDLFIVIFFVTAVILYGLTLGKERILIVLVSIYSGVAVTWAAPFLSEEFLEQVQQTENAQTIRIAVFLGVILLTFGALAHTGIFSGFGSGGHILNLLLVSILQVGLLVSSILALLAPDTQAALSETMRQVFLSPIARSIWVIFPLLATWTMKASSLSTRRSR